MIKVMIPPAPFKRVDSSDTNDNGKRAMIPTMIMIEIPLPIPLSVIFSPNHITNMVPEVRISTEDIVNKVEFTNTALAGTMVFK
ncbi:hypothetical protein D3C79_943290 [compost metagenome]